MKEIVLAKVGEIVLKGLNRRQFEDQLLKNIRNCLKSLGSVEVKAAQSTISIVPQDEFIDLDEVCERISRIFGIVTYSRAAVCDEKSLESVLKTAPEYLAEQLESAKTFKVEAKRSDKKFPFKSPEICRETGGKILQAFPHLKVDVHNPDLVVNVEIRDFGAYIHGKALRGAGGIPVGTGGNAAILISGGIDSPVAAYMMAKRGIRLTAIHFASPPYTSERAEQKVVKLLKKVARYSGNMNMYTVPFTEIQETIRKKCPEDYFTIIMRRLMMKISERIAEPRSGREPDNRRDCVHRRGGEYACFPSVNRNGQAGNHRYILQDRHLRDLYRALRGLLHGVHTQAPPHKARSGAYRGRRG